MVNRSLRVQIHTRLNWFHSWLLLVAHFLALCYPWLLRIEEIVDMYKKICCIFWGLHSTEVAVSIVDLA